MSGCVDWKSAYEKLVEEHEDLLFHLAVLEKRYKSYGGHYMKCPDCGFTMFMWPGKPASFKGRCMCGHEEHKGEGCA